MLVAFDLDGTLANIDHRLHHVKNKPKCWVKFNEGIKDDLPNLLVVEVLKSLRASGHDIIFMSARQESCREETEKWLVKNGISAENPLLLYMRDDKDYREDSLVKEEMLEQVRLDFGKWPDMMFDDRPRVVSMWKKLGVFVFDVYQGSEDF